MSRLTNLFYTSGPESKFITFSNYTESVTGNFLSTDTKIFPSRFLCAYIDGLTEKSKSLIITKLVEYYESKLAFLRDHTENAEEDINPLYYLLEFFYSIKSISDEKIDFNPEYLNNKTSYLSSPVFDLNYISDITEQDYNGQYTDMIFNVSLDSFRKPAIKINQNTNKTYKEFTEFSTSYLYGWKDYTLENYKTSYSIPDKVEDSSYYYCSNSIIDKIYCNIPDNDNYLKFNILIPLYDTADVNVYTNSTAIEELNYLPQNNYTKNVPLGIWFSTNCKPIELYRDLETGFGQTWSLTLSSQFKPMPSSTVLSKKYEYKNPDNRTNSFNTFAQVLSKENDIIDKMNYNASLYDTLNTRITKLETIINKLKNK